MASTYTHTVTTPASVASASGKHVPFVSLLSDFGLRDASAGIMRAVVAGICPAATIIDLSHDVDKFSIRDGALTLWNAVPYLPIGAHVAVVDPGVGTARLGIVLETARGDFLVGPDNGLLMPAAARLGGITQAYLLENPHYQISPVSSSFHGRDIFAPAAAHLAARVPVAELGRAVDPRTLVELPWAQPQIMPGRLLTDVVYLDSFGNVKLSALAEDLRAALPAVRIGEPLVVRLGRGPEMRELRLIWAVTFGSVPPGAALLAADSYGRVSLAVHQGSAAARFGIKLDEIVEVTRPMRLATPTVPSYPHPRDPRR